MPSGAGRHVGVPVDAYRSGADIGDGSASLAEVYGVGPSGAVLVRPDGFVAWRARAAEDDAEGVLAAVFARAVARSDP